MLQRFKAIVDNISVWKKGIAVISIPLLVLVLWELLVNLGYLNGRWFPPPTRIAAALWDLIVTFDRFNGTSLLGRPWLIPSIWVEEGWEWGKPLSHEAYLAAKAVQGLLAAGITRLLLVVVPLSLPAMASLGPLLSPPLPCRVLTVLWLWMGGTFFLWGRKRGGNGRQNRV